MPKDRTLAYIALLVTALLWAVAGPVIKVTFREGVAPFTFLTIRFAANALIVLPLLIYYLKKHPINWRDAGRLSGLTILGTTLTLALIFLGYERTTALDGALIISTAPLFIIAAGAVFLKEKITRLERAGLAVALLGISITVVQPILEKGFFAQENLVGNLLLLASNVTWMFFTIESKEDFKHHSPFLITTFSFVFGFLTFLPMAFAENPQFISEALSFTPLAWVGILYMSLFSSVIAYFTYAYGISKIEVSEAALFMYLQPILAAPFAYMWLGEEITPTFLLGAAAIALGVILTEYRPPRVAQGGSR